MNPTERFLRACRREPVDRPPIWIMRQAGRYLPTYRALRKRASFLEVCRSPGLATEVTLMPVEQVGVDAAILFSDILVPLEPMGLDVAFNPGPHIAAPVRSARDVERLRGAPAADDLGYVYEAVESIVEALDGRVPLLGFAGAPFTLATYAVEGGTSRNHHELKALIYRAPEVLESLLQRLTDVVIAYLRRQIEAGVVAVQLFDTWGGVLSEPHWRRFSMPYTRQVIEALRDTGAPIIHYLKDGAHLLAAQGELPCEVLSVDWRQPLGAVRGATGDRHALQGNLDPAVLRAPREVIAAEARRVLESYGREPGHIFNLGHGITPEVTVEAAKTLVDAVRELGPAFGGDVSV